MEAHSPPSLDSGPRSPPPRRPKVRDVQYIVRHLLDEYGGDIPGGQVQQLIEEYEHKHNVTLLTEETRQEFEDVWAGVHDVPFGEEELCKLIEISGACAADDDTSGSSSEDDEPLRPHSFSATTTPQLKFQSRPQPYKRLSLPFPGGYSMPSVLSVTEQAMDPLNNGLARTTAPPSAYGNVGPFSRPLPAGAQRRRQSREHSRDFGRDFSPRSEDMPDYEGSAPMAKQFARSASMGSVAAKSVGGQSMTSPHFRDDIQFHDARAMSPDMEGDFQLEETDGVSKAMYEELVKENKRLTRARDELYRQIENAEADAMAALQEMSQKLDQARIDLAAAKKDEASLRYKEQEHTLTIQSLEGHVEQLKASLAAMEAAHKKKQADWQQQLEHLKASQEEVVVDGDDDTLSTNALDKSLADAASSAHAEEMSALREQLRDANQLNAQILAHEEENQRLQTEVADLRDQLHRRVEEQSLRHTTSNDATLSRNLGNELVRPGRLQSQVLTGADALRSMFEQAEADTASDDERAATEDAELHIPLQVSPEAPPDAETEEDLAAVVHHVSRPETPTTPTANTAFPPPHSPPAYHEDVEYARVILARSHPREVSSMSSLGDPDYDTLASRFGIHCEVIRTEIRQRREAEKKERLAAGLPLEDRKMHRRSSPAHPDPANHSARFGCMLAFGVTTFAFGYLLAVSTLPAGAFTFISVDRMSGLARYSTLEGFYAGAVGPAAIDSFMGGWVPM